jgi:hypothetical protein
MTEWWAYLADILTFYNERVANQAYLHTADLPESVNRLIQLLGYRRRPGIGAFGILAALATGPNPFTLLQGFQIQSKPGPGEQPQVFELDSDVTITPPLAAPGSNAVQGTGAVQPAPVTPTSATISQGTPVVLAGTSSAVKTGDRVLILPIVQPGKLSDFAVATVATVTHAKDPSGNAITSVTFSADITTLLSADITQYHLLGNSQSSQVWQYPAQTGAVIQLGPNPHPLQVNLAAIVRSIKSGDPIVFEGPSSATVPLPQCGALTNSTEVVWYANPAGYDPTNPSNWDNATPAVPPATPSSSHSGPLIVPIAIPHTQITFAWNLTAAPSDTRTDRSNYQVRYAWKDIANLITVPPATVAADSGSAGSSTATPAPTAAPITLQPPAPSKFPATAVGAIVLVEDTNGRGAQGLIDTDSSMHLTSPVPLLLPLRVLYNLLSVSRGRTVLNEVLGNGNALVANQDFMLQKAPVTYFQSPDSTSGDNYSSTVRVWVNQVEWKEVRSFYRQPAGAQVFLTREDEQGYTHVVFGSQLPTGVNNVVASYRYGSGADVPAAGSLTVVLQPQPGLRSIRNPVPVGGGSDPDPPSKIRQLAPRSVLTFNRAVSVDDFEVIAAQAPSVTRAKAAVAFDPLAQRPRVTVWVGDDQDAVTSAQAAFAASADPNRLPLVVLANAVVMQLSLSIVYDPRYHSQTVQNAVQTALLDPDSGLFGVNVVDIGQVFYDSQVYATCLAVPGVVAVHSLDLAPPRPRFQFEFRFKNPPVTAVSTTCCGQRHDPGQGAYFSIPNDSAHVTLATEAAT